MGGGERHRRALALQRRAPRAHKARRCQKVIARLRELFEAAREVEDPAEFLETVKVDLFAARSSSSRRAAT